MFFFAAEEGFLDRDTDDVEDEDVEEDEVLDFDLDEFVDDDLGVGWIISDKRVGRLFSPAVDRREGREGLRSSSTFSISTSTGSTPVSGLVSISVMVARFEVEEVTIKSVWFLTTCAGLTTAVGTSGRCWCDFCGCRC